MIGMPALSSPFSALEGAALMARIWEKVSPEPNSGCWLWTGCASADRGRMNVNGKPQRVYRLTYQLLVGPIPDGRLICHKCNIPLCVNPDHLYAGTSRQNHGDAIAAGTHTCVRHRERFTRISKSLLAKRPSRLHSTGKSIIPHSEIASLLERRAAGESCGSIGRTYGVTSQAVSAFLKRAIARAALAKAKAGA